MPLNQFTPVMGEPVRFLAIEWREDWEFDHPSVVLFPVFRYSPNGTDLESMIEDAALDVAMNAEKGKSSATMPSDTDWKEFKWRGWDLFGPGGICEIAWAVLDGKELPRRIGSRGGFIGVRAETAVFRKDGDEILFDVTAIVEKTADAS